ncbi:uncharacterized protein LOC142350574 isoform X2 [Convolutriloba macropyga]|uniref:uncharacterized protein LOC142350574 isoform X2 n=1 Tax=Convolutriloba macropyga TaxID=536237 RepID=UPI003F521557
MSTNQQSQQPSTNSKPINISTYGMMKVSMHPSDMRGFGFEAESIGPIQIIQDDDNFTPIRAPKGQQVNTVPNLRRSETDRTPSRKSNPTTGPYEGRNTPRNSEDGGVRYGSLPGRSASVVEGDVPGRIVSAFDQPVYTIKAHVFFIEPNGSKKEWTPAAQGAVPVNIYYDTPRQSYRIISIVDSKAIVNSALSSEYTFIKTSHKFGQWLDSSSGILYGLGFANEAELTNFSKKFNQFKDDATPPPPVTTSNRYNEEEDPVIMDQKPYDSLYSANIPTKDYDTSPVIGSRNKSRGRDNNRLNDSDDFNRNVDESDRLKLELDKSKNQLTQINRENRKKEDEIGTLKKNNQKLTNALKESAANVEEWKKLLHKYREESLEAKNKIADMEAAQKEKEEQMRLAALEDERMQNLLKELQDKDREITILNKELLTAQNEANRLQIENNRLKGQVDQLEDELDRKSQDDGKKKKENFELASQLNSKIQELQLMGTTLQSKI